MLAQRRTVDSRTDQLCLWRSPTAPDASQPRYATLVAIAGEVSPTPPGAGSVYRAFAYTKLRGQLVESESASPDVHHGGVCELVMRVFLAATVEGFTGRHHVTAILKASRSKGRSDSDRTDRSRAIMSCLARASACGNFTC